MKSRKLRAPLLLGAIAAVAATAWANTYEASPSTTAVQEPLAVTEPQPIAVSETLSPNETLVYSETVVTTEPAPFAQPPITVEERRLTRDESIQLAVMDLLRNNDRLSGKIGVESNDAVVRLSGYTMTAGQARRAGQAAHSVQGVKYVVNEIQPRIGGSI